MAQHPGGRRTLKAGSALMLLALLIAGVVVFVALAVSFLDERNERMVDLVSQLARFQRAAMPNPENQAASVDASALHKTAFLAAADDAVVAAELQSRLRAIITGRSGQLSSVRVLPVRQTDTHTWIGLRVQMRGSMKNIRDILYSIENGKPFLFVERSVLRLEERRGAVIASNEDEISSTFAELDIFGAKWNASPQADRTRPK